MWCLGTGLALTLPCTAGNKDSPWLTYKFSSASPCIYHITLCTQFFSFSQQWFFKWRPPSGFLQHVMIKCSNIWENCTASIFKVTEFNQVEVKCCDKSKGTYIQWLQGSWPITAMKDKKMAKDCPRPLRVRYPLETIQSPWKWRQYFGITHSTNYRTYFPGLYSSDVYIAFPNTKLCL